MLWCFRVGHLSKSCKSKPRFVRYGENRHNSFTFFNRFSLLLNLCHNSGSLPSGSFSSAVRNSINKSHVPLRSNLRSSSSNSDKTVSFFPSLDFSFNSSPSSPPDSYQESLVYLNGRLPSTSWNGVALFSLLFFQSPGLIKPSDAIHSHLLNDIYLLMQRIFDFLRNFSPSPLVPQSPYLSNAHFPPLSLVTLFL